MVTSPRNLRSPPNSSLALPTHGGQFSELTTSEFIVQVIYASPNSHGVNGHISIQIKRRPIYFSKTKVKIHLQNLRNQVTTQC